MPRQPPVWLAGTGGNSTGARATVPPPAQSPSLLAWRGTPTTLFMEDSCPFTHVELSRDGNLLGYAASGVEIYGSNYDYDNSVDGKVAGRPPLPVARQTMALLLLARRPP